jgi:hypothetical protein
MVFPTFPVWMMCVFGVIALWEAIWKAIALWKAARNDHMGWFIALVIFNTAGILPIIYIAFFSRPKRAAKRR